MKNQIYHKIVKFNSIAIFRRIGKVEAKVHGTTINRIHFHEVGAIDSIIDIVGGSLAMDLLDADLIVSSPINIGEGIVKCRSWHITRARTSNSRTIKRYSLLFYAELKKS